ncbi:acyl-CoA thioester hydrolase [Litorivivens lipolytica]|uniref:Acyl-CoA thioester hydrolase n=1 Tax=Litorivivens lipolytica TaxID=1524264 RepID=A0A7W4Z6P9_9GAMM|nr:thioesterase family protein [Litorivivens lipolytica]MBB3048754.1 acyl-CoA thioester hydrolase [Litorivivens lipolytica]
MDRKQRDTYKRFYPITTRWMDNDIYGHVNNVTYYSWFDSAANRFLIEECGLDIHNGEMIGFVVSSGCEYLSPVAYPDEIEVGLAIEKLGNSSVRYNLAIFKVGEETASAHGHFVHVFVQRDTQQATRIPDAMREAMTTLLIG